MASDNRSQPTADNKHAVRKKPCEPWPTPLVIHYVSGSSSDSSSDESPHRAGHGKRRCPWYRFKGTVTNALRPKPRQQSQTPLVIHDVPAPSFDSPSDETPHRAGIGNRRFPPAENIEDEDEGWIDINDEADNSTSSDTRESAAMNTISEVYRSCFTTFEKGGCSEQKMISPTKPPYTYSKDLPHTTLEFDHMTKRFPSPLSQSRYLEFEQRYLIQERFLCFENMSSIVKSVVVKNGLLETILVKEPAAKDVILEFFANFCPTSSEDKIYNVSVRGRAFEFSPQLINKVLCTNECPWEDVEELKVDVSMDAVARYLTGNQVNEWISLTPSMLLPSMRILFRLCCTNWIPTSDMTRISPESGRLLYLLGHNQVFNFGRLVYDQVFRVVCHPCDSDGLPFPSLINQVLLFQHQFPLLPNEVDEVTTTMFEPVSASGDLGFG